MEKVSACTIALRGRVERRGEKRDGNEGKRKRGKRGM